MEAVTQCEKEAGQKFQKHLETYQKELGLRHGSFRVYQRNKGKEITLGEAVFVPDSDVHHVFDSKIIQAICRSIEDLALENGKGEFISTFDNFSSFLPHQDRYHRLAERLDAVRVWGAGQTPEDSSRIDFIYANDPKIMKYRLTLYESENCRAMLLCRQLNRTQNPEAKKFVGFYSFNPYLVQSIRWRFNLLSSGLSEVLDYWEKSFRFPKINSKHLKECKA